MSAKISAIILAGGEARRMNHANKGLKNYRDDTLVSHVIKSLAAQVDDIVVSANRDLEDYKQYGYPVVPDEGTSQGPLSGIASASKHCKHDLVFITACDMPNLPNNIVKVLKDNMTGEAVMAKTGNKIEPLVSLVRKHCTDRIFGLLAKNNRSVMHWLESCDAAAIEVQDVAQNAFLNINTPSELGEITN